MRTVQAKVVVLGSQGVGKTSMVVRYIDKMFSHQISPTIGASFFTCNMTIDDTRVKLQIWDTAGQERFRSMAPMYYRNANAALLVFDITQHHTFTAVKHWVKELQSNVEESMVLCLVGNKTDLSSQRKVPQEEACQYAESIGGFYYESSALHDQGIEEIILNTAVQLIKLSRDPNCNTIKVYETSESIGSAASKEIPSSSGAEVMSELGSPAHDEQAKQLCC